MQYINNKNIVYTLGKKNHTVMQINSGETVTLETLDCFGDYFYNTTVHNTEELPPSNPATGPIFINEAKKGDCLKITIEKIELGKKGVIESVENCGCLGKRVKGKKYKLLDINNNHVQYSEDISIEMQPMIGVIGVAPENSEISTLIPGKHGGNLDCSDIREGTILYLPVFVDGALLAVGDLHGIMGDGEIGYSGLETNGKVNLRVDVVKSFPLDEPIVLYNRQFILLSSAETLDAAAEQASLAMHDFLYQNGTLASEDIVRLLTLMGDLGICQAVNPMKTIKLSVPIWLLDKANVNLP